MLACVILPPDRHDASRRLCTVSPLVETRGELAFLDVRGTGRLHGGTAGLFSAVREALAPDLPRGMALAANRFTAEVAARVAPRLADGALVVPPGDEAAFLASLPLGVLPLRPELARRIAPLGLRTLGDLASLPVEAVSRRYGADGVVLHRLARGEDESGLVPDVDDAPPAVRHELEHPARDLESLAPALDQTLVALCAALEERGLAVVRLAVDLDLDEVPLDDDVPAPDGDLSAAARAVRFEVSPAEPEERVELLRDLVLLELGRRPPGAPVVAVTLTAGQTAAPAVHQGSLLGLGSRDAARHREALSRLTAVLGERALSSPVTRRAHRTEDRWHHGEAPAVPPVPAARPSDGLSLRWFERPPLLVPVRAGGELIAFRHGRRELVVARLSAPRRLEGGWWCDPWARDEYDLLTPQGEAFRICRDMTRRRWLLLAEAD